MLPILDSIIGSKQCTLQHLQFPQAWRGHCQTALRFRSDCPILGLRSWGFVARYSTFKPDPSFVSFLSQYNQVLMNRGTISCVTCSRNLPSSGYELVGSIFSDDDRKNSFMFGKQNQTCSRCMKHYCYRCEDWFQRDHQEEFRDRCNGYGEFLLERCSICEKDRCVDCSGMYRCEGCSKYYCMGCKEGTACSDSGCEKKICSDCALKPRQCHKCNIEGFCLDCAKRCGSCDDIVCHNCEDTTEVDCSNCYSYHYDHNATYGWCHACVLSYFETCQQCKKAFCGSDNDGCDLRDCHNCKKRSCVDCSNTCQICEKSVCDECSNNFTTCSNDVCGNEMCKNCASVKTCQQCKGTFCCGVELTQCLTCTQTFCQDCVTLRQCGNLVPGPLGGRCSGYHCVDCPDESSFVEVARTCTEIYKYGDPCDVCKSTRFNRFGLSRCDRCSRTSCKTWQSEKKLLDGLHESKKDSGRAEV